MSLERRQYDARLRGATVSSPSILPHVVTWDEEASHRAIVQAQDTALRDPEASQYLAGQFMAQPIHATVHVYDPPRVYAQMLLVAGLKDWEIDQMHFVRFFGQVREITLAKEREREQERSTHPEQDMHDL